MHAALPGSQFEKSGQASLERGWASLRTVPNPTPGSVANDELLLPHGEYVGRDFCAGSAETSTFGLAFRGPPDFDNFTSPPAPTDCASRHKECL